MTIGQKRAISVYLCLLTVAIMGICKFGHNNRLSNYLIGMAGGISIGMHSFFKKGN